MPKFSVYILVCTVSLLMLACDDSINLTEQQIRFPVFIPAEQEAFSNKNKLHTVPQTILRNSGGIVEKVWRGRLTVDQFNEVVQAISESIIHQIP